MWHTEQPYEPISDDPERPENEDIQPKRTASFSYIEYAIFFLLGICMLWAWNMFLAAGPYFQHRFRSNDWISENFQAAEISISTFTNLVSMLVLTKLQAHASYPKRIISSLFINMAVFALLALSTSAFLDMSATGYFVFLVVTVFATSLATGLCQNGIFAYVSGFGEPIYTQSIMTGQAVAGVLPCIAQIVSVLSVEATDRAPGEKQLEDHTGPPHDPQDPSPVRSNAALAYFLTATIISVITLFAFIYLLRRDRVSRSIPDHTVPEDAVNKADSKTIPLRTLARKLFWLASAVFATFAVTMVFPVFTQRIVSVKPPEQQSPILQAPVFIPLAFLLWNVGDLLGRLATAIPQLSLVRMPRLVFFLAITRLGFVGLYHLCNIRGQGAVIKSDLFYLVVVQMLFGLTNGFLGSTCMVGAAEWVEPYELEAAGGFMGLCLVAGLTAGSLASFFATGS